MPPAFVLSQDQTLKFVSRYKSSQPKGQPSHRTELQEPIPALVKRNGYEGHIRHRLNQPVSRAQRPPDRAPSPTCPFIKTNNVKEPTRQKTRTTSPPRFLTRGACCPYCPGDRSRNRRKPAPSAAVRGPLSPSPPPARKSTRLNSSP